jgi:hypothetical protein
MFGLLNSVTTNVAVFLELQEMHVQQKRYTKSFFLRAKIWNIG